ncbi:MAG TPA: BPSS1780 family membrane protein [Usitatibacter sp.]|nr:BPSS1780 family membrane protein [Usitatibacter sp.]
MATTQAKTAEGEALDAGLRLVVPGKATPASAGWEWIAGGWQLFVRAPLMWIISLVILFVIAIVLAFIPFLGSLAFQVMQSVFAGGLVAACRNIERGGDFELEHLFAGFKVRFVPLLIVGLIFLAACLVLMLMFFAVAGLSLIPAFLTGDSEAVSAAMAGSIILILLASLVLLALFVPVVAAYWFAPALVMMHDMPPIDAMKASFHACFRNFVPFLLYGLVMSVGFIIAMIPFGLGMLVWVPVAIASTYVGYRQIFTEEAAAAPARPAMVQ